MRINDVIEASKEGRYVILEDPLNGSTFLKNKTEFDPDKTYLCIDGTIVPLEIITSTKLDETEATVTINRSKIITIRDNENVLVVTRKYLFSDEDMKMLHDDYNIEQDNLYENTIYDCILAPMRNVTSLLLQNRYPYIDTSSYYDMMSSRYVSNISIMYNNNVVVPRKVAMFYGDTLLKSEMSKLEYISNKIDTDHFLYMMDENFIYVYNGEDESLLQLVDIQNNIFFMKNHFGKSPDNVLGVTCYDIYNLLYNSVILYKDTVCIQLDKDTSELFDFIKSNDEDKYDKYDTGKLKEQFIELVGNGSALAIMEEGEIAQITDVKEFDKPVSADKEEENVE